MITGVSRLRSRSGSVENSLEAYASGDFRLSVEMLSEDRSAVASILRGRALLRLGCDKEALDEVDRLILSDLPDELVAESFAIKAYALFATHRAVEAEAIAIEVRARCYSAGFIGIEPELLFASAFGALIEGDEQAAAAAVEAILNFEDLETPWAPSTSFRHPLSYWRAKACDIRAGLEHARSNHSGQSKWMRKALDEFDKSGVRDDYFETALLANYADAAISGDSNDITEFVISRSTKIDWTPTLSAQEFRLFSALAEAASVRGDQIGALRYFRRCLTCAPSAALQIRASVERARLLGEIGETFSSREELDHALRLSKTVNWDKAGVLEQRQLVFLAAQIASFHPLEAKRLLQRYDALLSSSSFGIALKDDRFRGEEFLARAAVMFANGERDRAVVLLLDALTIWTSAGYISKAATAAAELAELTHEPHYVEIAKAESRKQPLSILARKMARYDANLLQPSAPTATFESLVPATFN